MKHLLYPNLTTFKKFFSVILLLLSCTAYAQTIMFDDFTYTSVDDPQLPVFNKWNIISGVSGPPEGGMYSRSNITFVNDPANSSNRLITLSSTVNGTTKATTHSRIETGGYEYFEGTYAARVYLSDVPFTYKDGTIQTFYTIVSSALAGDGTKYSELDIVEYMAADKWGISPDNRVAYYTSWNKYRTTPDWAAWKTYFAVQGSIAGWHTFIAQCTDGVNVKYWIDDTYLGAQSRCDGNNPDGDTTSPVYPRSNMQVAFANWIWNNVTGSSTSNRTTTMQADWVLYYKNTALTKAQVDALVSGYRTQGLQRRNLLGQTYVTGGCTVPTQPGGITGNTTVTQGSSQTYSIAAVSGATSYTWTLPSGWSGSSTGTSITTTAGTTGGTISVTANNACGASTARTLNVTVSTCSVPAQPGAISGNTSVAAGSAQTYSVSAVSGATSYTWTLPSGWTGSSSSTSISTTAGTSGGTISVRANNACGAGTARTLNVTVSTGSSNLALGRPVQTSSVEAAGLEGGKAVDGSSTTRWASLYSDPQWIYVDLGSNYNINRVKITWEAAYGRDYQVQTSANASTWSTIKPVTGNTTLVNDHTGLTGTGRYVRINGTARGTSWGYSIFELEVYGTPASGGFTSRIEAENYLHMAGVIKETCSEGGQNIGSFDAYDWMSYNISIPTAGTYRVSYRVASIYSGRTIRLEKDNGATLLGTVTAPNTPNWQSYATVSHDVTLPAGSYAIGLTTYTGGININWFEISSIGGGGSVSAVEAKHSRSKLERVSFYPNPVKRSLQIDQSLDEPAHIQFLDSKGNVVLKKTIQQGEREIDINELPGGLYMLRIWDQSHTRTERIIKE
jgi:hypothetical protein